jgi:sialic acid synthase SpsE
MNKHTYIIGEIGQNHNGSVDLAKLLIDLVSRPIEEELFGLDLPGMDAVKLTKRDLSEELSADQMSRPYDSPHSFGKTYGEHRAELELSDAEHFDVYNHAKLRGLDFVETLCAIGCLSVLKLFQPDYLKVASRDLTNLPLLAALGETKIPMILSTGMAGRKELDHALETIGRYHHSITILHCVSEYPTHPVNVNLKTIDYLQEHYSEFRIGYSDHTVGIATPAAAVAMGAEMIEKHITLDRRMKGTDQAGSLGPEGVLRMVRDIRLTDMSMGKKEIFISDGAKSASRKLERSIATKTELKSGHLITESDVHMLSPGDGFRWSESSEVIGKTVVSDLSKDQIIYKANIHE